MTPRPRLQALLLAERIYTDAATGKRVIAGTFNTFRSSAFPLGPIQVMVYASLTDIRGASATVELRFVDTVDLGVVVQSSPVAVEARNPQDTSELALPVPIYLPHPGIYDFELHADGEKLGSLRVTAVMEP